MKRLYLRRRSAMALSYVLLLRTAATASGQEAPRIEPVLLTERWPASWIAHPTTPAYEYGVVHFRRAFDLTEVPSAFVVHVSGDNRYRLFVNGRPVVSGPAISDLRHWRFETVDLAPLLRPGRNVLAAKVWNGGEFRPMAQMTNRTAFVLQGGTPREHPVNTDTTWRVVENRGYRPINWLQNDPRFLWEYYVAGATDSIRADRFPWGWEAPDFDDRDWVRPRQVTRGAPIGVESHQAWQLTPRTVPLLREKPQRFRRVARSEGAALPAAFLAGGSPATVPPHTRATFLVDQGRLTTGYPALTLSGGASSSVRLTYAEALYERDKIKGHRERVEGQHLWGIHDVFVTDGGRGRVFQPLNPRAFRWIEIEVQTAAEPLVLEDFASTEVIYPSTLEARFASDRETLRGIWDAGWRTLELSAQETFISDLYWERMQYIGDTKVQALAWMYLTRDDRLVRLALEHFDASRAHHGLTQSRYPAFLEQYTPLYALAWTTMVHDFWMHRRDDAFLHQFLPGVRQVLDWFERNRNADGMIEPLFHLDFVDWSYQRRRDEIARGAGNRGMAVHTLFYAYALDRAAEVLEGLGHPDEAATYRERARRLKETVYRLCFNESRGLMADTPDRTLFSQHANVLSVLTDAIPHERQREVMERTLREDLLPVDFYFEFYMGRALNRAGLGDLYTERMEPWEAMLRVGMRTFGEVKTNPRSEVHAWTASPSYEFLATVLGVEPAAPGFARVRIRPHPGALRRIEGVVPHPAGDIAVRLRRRGATGLNAEVTLPPGLAGTFHWKGQEVELREGPQRLSF